MKYFLFILITITVVACNQHTDDKAFADYTIADYYRVGDSVTAIVQQQLVQHVMKAIETGGTAYAVNYCNERAIFITDSLSSLMQVRIQRLSDKNRNPINQLSATSDLAVHNAFLSNAELKDSVVHINGKPVYYKRIHIAMPTCLSCHGNTKTDIAAGTFQQINKLYPKDRATGYLPGDYRGMWKVSFSADKK